MLPSVGMLRAQWPGGLMDKAPVVSNCGNDLVRGTLETMEFDQHFFGDAAFGPDRREYVRHDLFSPFEFCWAVVPYWRGIWQSGPGSGAIVSAVRGPHDGAVLEIQSDQVADVREHHAIGDLSADGGFIFQGSDLCHFANLPGAAGNHAHTVSTDVICIGQFWFVGRFILRLGEADNDSDWYAFLHASAKYALDGHRGLGLAGWRSLRRGAGGSRGRFDIPPQRINSTEGFLHQSGEDLKWGSG